MIFPEPRSRPQDFCSAVRAYRFDSAQVRPTDQE
ncbi:hypothetical protein N601_31425 [Rhodococcus erythropolis DN1]|nr:hypothetical protein N601_31425 [Rhodococcus erythropolis DN1]